MKLDYKVVPAVEVKGEWDTSGVFIASDIEELPKPRRPKLRGTIQAVDIKSETITLYGIPIQIEDRTQFLDADKEGFSIKDLKVGDRVEISCNIDKDDGEWEARKISIKEIKDSDKIKGTITKTSIDGNPPDTIEIYDLIIILDEKTDVNEPAGSSYDIEKEIFDKRVQIGHEYWASYRAMDDKLLMGLELRHTLRSESEFDLDEHFLSDYSDAEPEVRMELSGILNERFQFLSQLRLRKKYPINNDGADAPSHNLETVFTQLYLAARNVGLQGLALQLGRQDFDEQREWLFDEYLDAVRLFYSGKRPMILEAAYIHSNFPIKDKFETWSDFFCQARYYFYKDNMLRGYFLLRKDSDETRNREPVWWGISYYGEFLNSIRPWLELSLMRGQDKGETLRASAFDIGFTFLGENIKYNPSVSFGYAAGTGDKTGGDGIDNDFRQTGYEDNTDYLGGVITQRYYGELLDPELSNIKILTLAAGVRPLKYGSVEIVYHDYSQSHYDDRVRGELVDPPARPNEIYDDLGWELDFVLGLVDLWDRLSLAWVIGIFEPGKAFAPYQERATLNKFNIKFEI